MNVGIDFGDALMLLRRSKCVMRASWKGMGRHVYLEDGGRTTIKGGVFKGETRTYDPYLVIFTSQGTHQAGWVPTQADMLADDWMEVNPDEPH